MRRALVVAALALSAGACGPSSGRAPATATGPTLTGAWRSKVQFQSGSFALIHDLEFSYVFNEGGTMTESSNYDEVPPATPAYGIWRRTGPRAFEAKYVFYMTKPPVAWNDIESGGGWLPAGHGELLESITLGADGNHYTSKIRFTVYDSTGAVSGGVSEATGAGTRIVF
ncbi:MAG: hypothetical protein ACM3JJ_06515 [Hyphomicrobiales bacterium]